MTWQHGDTVKLNEDAQKNWFAVIEVAEQGRTRVRITKRDVARFKGQEGERLEQLQLPTITK